MSHVHFREAQAPAGVRLYAIGDVHGRFDLLAAMHAEIAAEIDRGGVADWRIVHLGDYVDRGPDSKGVIDLLVAADKRDGRHIFLAGNHDVGFLDFLDHPDPDGLFMHYGGVQTAQSYGIDLTGIRRGNSSTADSLRSCHAGLLRAVPQSHVDFLRSLTWSATYGDFFFCHAGIRPGVALEGQDPQDLIWIRDAFLSHPGLYTKVIVHGHTPQAVADVQPNRVNVDTLAWKSGRLSALVIDGAVKTVLSVTEDGTVQRSEAVTP